MKGSMKKRKNQKRSNAELEMEQLCELMKTNVINNPKLPLCFVNKMQPYGKHISISGCSSVSIRSDINLIVVLFKYDGNRKTAKAYQGPQPQNGKVMGFHCSQCRGQTVRHYISIMVQDTH